VSQIAAQVHGVRVGVIDFDGFQRVSRSKAARAIAVKEGDIIRIDHDTGSSRGDREDVIGAALSGR